MQVAALYDIHGNLPALEALLRDVHRENVDLVVVGGDVFPGPMPRETLACLLSLDVPVRFIHGNGDREVLSQMAGTETDWYRTAAEQCASPMAGRRGSSMPSRSGAWGRGLRHFIWRSTE